MKHHNYTKESYDDIPYDWNEDYIERDELPVKGMSRKQLKKFSTLKRINKRQFR